MLRLVLAIVAFQIGFAGALRADTLPAEKSIGDVLPLFDKAHCSEIKDPAGQLFCGDPELNQAGAHLSRAVAERISRLADRRIAIQDDAAWVRNRNSSCGIFAGQSVRVQDVPYVKSCLLKETEERIEILSDPNFDCLATNTTAGMLICSDPALAIGQAEFNDHALALIAKLKEDEAREAFAEYARWMRERDRKCDLAGKDNVPLEELAPSAGCLADYIRQKTAEIVAAKGDARRVFGRHQMSPAPDADAVDLCVAQIHVAHSCNDFLRVNRVVQVNGEMLEQSASVVALIEMVVLSPFAVCSPVASSCTGMCWDLKPGQPKATPMSRDSIAVAHKLQIQKAFAFQKNDNGSWRCNTGALQPVDIGIATSGP